VTGLALVLRGEAVLDGPPDGPVVIRSPWARVSLGIVGPGMRAALDRLTGDGATEAALVDLVADTDGAGALATLYFALQRAAAHRLLAVTATFGGRRAVTAVPMTSAPLPAPAAIGPDDRVRLSRFAFARRGDDGTVLVVESPRSPVRVLLHDERGGALLAALAAPVTIGDLSPVPPDEASGVLGLLVAAGIAGVADERGTIVAEDTAALRQWEFHDLLFHARSRLGRHDLPSGGTYRFRGQLPPLPAVVPVATDRTTVALPHATGATGSLDAVLASRRSTRGVGATPLTIVHLGALLDRAAAAHGHVEADDDRPYAITRRPYPGAGAAYELELYPVVHRCVGLEPGLYRYDPVDHRLAVVAPPDAGTDRLLDDAAASAGMAERPEVLVVIAARFARVSWKYAAIAYSLVLKDVGVLLGTMTLVAASMGIGASALGAGDADLFAAGAGTDYDAETSVGELIIGGPR
jgi:SagB-type dehydrogenase family enzyme